MQSMTPVTGPEEPKYVVLCVQYESKKGGKDQVISFVFFNFDI